jgi:hypothetical protein
MPARPWPKMWMAGRDPQRMRHLPLRTAPVDTRCGSAIDRGRGDRDGFSSAGDPGATCGGRKIGCHRAFGERIMTSAPLGVVIPFRAVPSGEKRRLTSPIGSG